ncbi:MAG TPA: hypothetical protein PLS03_07325 [Terrimicrobiaceae bacterium]|nr:hypothetical protein [Terrimicrobiaceae bacterium]
MSVLYLTIFVSVVLVAIFVAGFLYHSLGASGDPLRDSLLPFRKDGRGAPDSDTKPPDHPKPL